MPTKTWGGHPFQHSAITPETDANGNPIEHMPQERYAKAATTPLNPHGRGPFCNFALPGLPDGPGVYVIEIDGRAVYVGMTSNFHEWLEKRGPGHISPANCFEDGPGTYCKINHGILGAAREGRAIHLWIHETADRHSLRKRLIAKLDLPWKD